MSAPVQKCQPTPEPVRRCKHDVSEDCPACAEETIASLKARAEQAERSVDVLESAVRKIQAKTEGERHTVNEQNVFKYWGLLNLMMIEIRDIARAAMSRSRGVARAAREDGK